MVRARNAHNTTGLSLSLPRACSRCAVPAQLLIIIITVEPNNYQVVGRRHGVMGYCTVSRHCFLFVGEEVEDTTEVPV